mgnify:FL=1
MSERTDPFRDIEELLDQLAQLGDSPGADAPLDVKDEGEAVVVVADLPGYDTADIAVELDGEDELSITAERTTSETTDGTEFVRRERHTERVERTVALPAPVDPGATTASHENGVLTVQIGRAHV